MKHSNRKKDKLRSNISEDEKITDVFVKITGLCVAILFLFLTVGFLTVLYSLIKAIGGLF